jgi:hypothetical protein
LTREEWTDFLTVFSTSNPRNFQMETLRSLGEWYAEHGPSWKFSAYSLLVAIFVSNVIFVNVFYSDVKLVRSRLGVDSSLDVMKQQMKTVPMPSTILPLWVSIVFFVGSWLCTTMVGRLVRNSGKFINLLPWVSPYDSLMDTVDDVVLSHTGNYWFDPPTVVDGTVMGWVPLVFVVAFGSIDRVACLSKLIQSLAMGYLFRVPSIIATIFPTSTSVLQAPQCYNTDQLSFWKGFITLDFCNDMVYSGHASLVVTPAVIIILMIVYGPYLHKVLPVVAVTVGGLFSVGVIIAGRFHYTADVLLTVGVCTLIAIVNAPAWKIIFSYSRYQLRIGSATSITKVAPLLEEACDKVVSITKSRRIDQKLTKWEDIDKKMTKLRIHIENATADMKVE